jgi:hypothetical protein
VLRRLKTPKDWFSQRVRVYFFDPIGLRLAPTNVDEHGVAQGFELAFPKAWMKRAMPYVKLGLCALKVASVAGKVVLGPACPDLGVFSDLISSQLKALDELAPELASELLAEVNKKCDAMLNGKLDELEAGESLKHELKAPVEQSARELDALLKEKFPDWKLKCGLVQVQATDGTTEWVLQEDEVEFKAKGAAMLRERGAASGGQGVQPQREAALMEPSPAAGSGAQAVHALASARSNGSQPGSLADENTVAPFKLASFDPGFVDTMTDQINKLRLPAAETSAVRKATFDWLFEQGIEDMKTLDESESLGPLITELELAKVLKPAKATILQKRLKSLIDEQG